MISTNLSTRPFYNERLVHTLLVALAVLVLAVTALNVTTIVTLSRKDDEQAARAGRAEKKATAARDAAQRVRRGVDPAELENIAASAAEANRLIDQRTFSWTDMLSEFEQALPPDARIAAVLSHAEKDGRLMVDISLVARRAEDVNDFADRLETRGAFADIAWRQEAIDADGLREITLTGRYVGKARQARGRNGGS